MPETCWNIKFYVGSNTETDLKEIKQDSIDWIELPQSMVQHWSLVNTVRNLRLP